MGVNQERFVQDFSTSVSPERQQNNRGIDCIEVPKVFDQCLIRRCLSFGNERTGRLDPDLRQVIEGVSPGDVLSFLGCRNFNITINSISKSVLGGEEGFKRVRVNFTVSFLADVELSNGTIRSIRFRVTRTETAERLYCPEPIAQVAASRVPRQGGEPVSIDLDPEIVKLEIVAECLEGDFINLTGNRVVLEITLGYFLIIKCELIVQLLVPTNGYCPAPPLCSEVAGIVSPCEEFRERPVPAFYPAQIHREEFEEI